MILSQIKITSWKKGKMSSTIESPICGTKRSLSNDHHDRSSDAPKESPSFPTVSVSVKRDYSKPPSLIHPDFLYDDCPSISMLQYPFLRSFSDHQKQVIIHRLFSLHGIQIHE